MCVASPREACDYTHKQREQQAQEEHLGYKDTKTSEQEDEQKNHQQRS